jgi:hypothetical protein
MIQLKPGYERVFQHIDSLSRQSWLANSQKFWPHHLFHFTDIKNAKSILTEGALFSRQRLIEMRKLDIDIASPEIIKTTPEKWKNHVRLYFRPRTPTQYRNEGIRPKDKLEYGGAHCPIPIVFIFDAKKILTLQSTSFSNGNLAAGGVEVDNNVDFFLSLPFEKIYHDTGFSRLDQSERNSIKFHRHADINFHFNPLSQESYSSLFNARLEIIEVKTNKRYIWEQKDFRARETLEFNLSNLECPDHYEVSFFLDDNLAYLNTYIDQQEILF